MLGVVDALLDKGLPPTGAPNLGGSLVTAGGLVFIGATNDSRFRAFDKDTGKELWVTRLPASGHATPMTFIDGRTGKQLIVIAAGGGNKYNKTYSDSLVAFALPSGDEEVGPSVQSHRATDSMVAESGRSIVPEHATDRPSVFSHRRHAPLKMACGSCHTSAETGTRASLPADGVCQSCHQSGVSLPVAHVSRLPDFVFFSHAKHYESKIACATCHGNVWKEKTPSTPLKMAACVTCHRSNRASTACTLCHELSQ